MYLYLFVCFKGREREWMKSSIFWFTPPNVCNDCSWFLLTPGARDPICVYHMYGKGSNTWTMFHCPPRSITRKLDQKLVSLNSKEHSSLASMPQHWLLHFNYYPFICQTLLLSCVLILRIEKKRWFFNFKFCLEDRETETDVKRSYLLVHSPNNNQKSWKLETQSSLHWGITMT